MSEDKPTPPARPTAERVEVIVREMLGEQAIRIAGLMVQLETAQTELAQRTKDYKAVLEDLNVLKAAYEDLKLKLPVLDGPKESGDGNPDR